MTTEHEVRAFVRRRRKAHDPRRLSDRLIDLYTWFLATAIAGIVIAPLIHGDLVPHPGAFLDTLDWLPVLLLGATWAVLRYGTWQGPVLFTTPELQWEVASPLNRRRLALMKLRRASIIAIGVGVVTGGLVGIGSAAMVRHDALGMTIAAVSGLTSLALLATALSWHVERSPSVGRVVDVATPVVLLLVALLAVAVARGQSTVALWSGPWGWAGAPVLAAGGRSVPGWVVLATLLGVAAVVALISAIGTVDRISYEELWQRSEARSSASAALFFGDVRAAKGIARRGRARGRFRGRELRMTRVATPWLAIVTRDTLTLRRNVGLVVVAASFIAAAMVAGVAATGRPILVAGVFAGLYAAASRLLETIRLENDRPNAHRMLPWTWGTILVLHCIVPTATLTVLIWIGLGVLGIGGFVAQTATWALILVAPFIAGAVVLPAAISASRRSFPIETLISGAELGALSLVPWLLTGPTLALIALGVASGWIKQSLDQGITMATFTAIAFLATATFAFGAWLNSRQPRDQ
ncbi:MAG: DUF6297 family protein [Acidimicrobiia bacterium]